jgi:serine protease Do
MLAAVGLMIPEHLRSKHTARSAWRGVRPGAVRVRAVVPCLLAACILAPSVWAADPFLRRTAAVQVVETAGPAVVNITTEHIIRAQSPFRSYRANPFWDRYFNELFDRRATQTLESLGSGVLISPTGHVLTNEHVIARASRIRILLADGREFDAEIVGADPSNDLAVLQVKTDSPLPWIAPGTSADVMVGEPVIAIGNPFGLSNTVTTGVISAIDRSIRANDHTFHGFLQTDASINPGNSGGPLLNAEGSLIGINSAIFNGAEGIGFAIPIDVATRVVAELIEHGEVLPVTLGIDFQDLAPALREVMELPEEIRGALINRVQPGGPAERAGIRRGDVVARLDGRRISSARQLFEMLESVTPDQALELELWRDSRTITANVAAERIPDNIAEQLTSRLMGLSLKIQPGAGFVVTDVRRGSAGEQLGLRPNDLVLAINGMALHNEEALRRAMLNLRGRERALIVVQRGPGRYHLTIPLR